MFQFELHPNIDEIHTDILVYEKGGVIKHIKAPARVKVELPDLWQSVTKLMRDDVEKGQIFFWKLEGQLYDKGENNFTKSAIPHHHGLF